MQDYPHHYTVSANGQSEGEIPVTGEGLETIQTMPPSQFGGPGDRWSPEDLLVASIADCFILTFRAVSRGARFEWNSVRCEVDGVLDRVDQVTRFTEFHMKVSLHVAKGADVHKATRLVERSEDVCLVTNSLTGECHLKIEIMTDH